MDLFWLVFKYYWFLLVVDYVGQFVFFVVLIGYYQLINEVVECYSYKNYFDELSIKCIECKLLVIKLFLFLCFKVEYFNGDSGYYEIIVGIVIQFDFRWGWLMLIRKQEWELIIVNLWKVMVVMRKQEV